MSDAYRMFRKAQKRLKHQSTRPEAVQLYKNDAFVTESLSATCASSVKFTADGQMSTKTIGKKGDRHLKAKLTLPELEERCDFALNKDLYRLSLRLAEIDTDTHADDESDKESRKPKEPKKHNHQNNLDRSRPKRAHKRDNKLDQTYNIKEKSVDYPDIKSKVNSEYAQNKNNKDCKKLKGKPVESIIKKHKKLKKLRPTNNKNSTSSSEESIYKTARTTQPQIRYKKRKDPDQKIELARNWAIIQSQIKREEQRLMKLRQSRPENWLLDFNFAKAYKEVIRVFKATMQIIDEWHNLTLLLLLVVAAYLIYVLCFDISLYVNEEKRYLAKMRKSNIVKKCILYVMRLLNVPIF